jgi:CNP1-like family protein
LKRLLAFALAMPFVLALAQPKSDWELEMERRGWKEGEYKLPALPKPDDLVEFYVSATTDFRFFIDRQSLSVGKDGVVRFTLLARSPSGAENVTYEGIRCSEGNYRVYAYARPEGGWRERDSEWRPIEVKTTQRWHNALWREYFCPQKVPIFDPAEGIDALRRGGHPNAAGLQRLPGGRF